MLKRARKINEKCNFFPGSVFWRSDARRENAPDKTASPGQRDHSERLTAIGVMWRGPGAARRPAAG
jgi:hypothetical protein